MCTQLPVTRLIVMSVPPTSTTISATQARADRLPPAELGLARGARVEFFIPEGLVCPGDRGAGEQGGGAGSTLGSVLVKDLPVAITTCIYRHPWSILELFAACLA